MIIETGTTGIPLSKIIEQLGNKFYPYIECRCKWTEEDGTEHDEFCGSCSYDNSTGKLTPLDHDSYSLEDLYDEWEETQYLDEGYFDGEPILLTVWEHGKLSEE